MRDSDTQVGKPFFDLLRNPSTAATSRRQITGYKVQAEQQYQQAKRISTPGDMTAAQRSFLITMEMRRDGLAAGRRPDPHRAQLGRRGRPTRRSSEIAGAMQLFLTLRRDLRERVYPFIEDGAAPRPTSARQRLQRTQFLPGIEWLDPTTVADALGQQLSADGGDGSGGEPAPGLHGTGHRLRPGGRPDARPDAPNRIPTARTPSSPSTSPTRARTTRSTPVVLRIEGAGRADPRPRTVDSVAPAPRPGDAGARPGRRRSTPRSTIAVEVKAGAGRGEDDNNTAEYEAAFSQQ